LLHNLPKALRKEAKQLLVGHLNDHQEFPKIAGGPLLSYADACYV
jgi:hypothetical protein